MNSENLNQTDTSQVELLTEDAKRLVDRLRLLLLASKQPSEQQIADVANLLSYVRVPDSWTDTVNSSNPDLSVATLNHVTRQITIIGGRGRMGKFFQEQLSSTGHEVSILGTDDWGNAEQLLNQADLVLVSVPIDWTVDVIKRAAKYLSPKTAIADITSLKTQPVQAMLQHHSGPVMGLHPMFGPTIESFSAQKVVVTPGRNDESFQWLLEFIQNQGGELIISTPAEHDRLMTIVQATRHFSRFSLGVFFAEETIDIERSLSMSTPSYRTEIDILKRLFAQSPHLCVDIMLATEERSQAIDKLAKTYTRLAQLVAQKDRAALIQEFEKTQILFE